MSFNLMASVIICSDFGAQENKVDTLLSVSVPIVSPSICHEVMGPDAMIFAFDMYIGNDKTLYVVLVFAVQQIESAICIHVAV